MYTKLIATAFIAMIVMAAYTNAYPADSESSEVSEFDAREVLQKLFAEELNKRFAVYSFSH